MFALSEAVQVALVTAGAAVIVAGIPVISIVVNKLVNRAVAAGSVAVLAQNTAEHLENSTKLDTIKASLATQDKTLERVELNALRQAEVINDHLSWHLHAPLSAPTTVVVSSPATPAGG
jgi:hypothetical protein